MRDEGAKPEWISASDAYDQLQDAGHKGAGEAIVREAYSGRLQARSEEISVGQPSGDFPLVLARAATLERYFWRRDEGNDLLLDWQLGIFSNVIVNEPELSGFLMTALGVEFCKKDIDQLCLQVKEMRSSSILSVSPKKSNRGRPRASKWAAWTAELTQYLHDNGFPERKDGEVPEGFITKINERLAERGLEEISRASAQPILKAVLDRFDEDQKTEN